MQDTVTKGDLRARQIDGLRTLAAALEVSPTLPVPTLDFCASSAEQVHQAAALQHADVHYQDGHTETTLVFGDGIEFRLFHVSRESMADYVARQSYSTVVQP